MIWSFYMNSEARWTFAFMVSKSFLVSLKELYSSFSSKIYLLAWELLKPHTRVFP